ncbi:MAG: hypothetical protein ACLTBI_13940 [Romboutsia timonensis]|uniref:hypothetical protein n=1 Tax=Romboutsia timonensis TaxID=1776391 RepID=UPI00399332BE
MELLLEISILSEYIVIFPSFRLTPRPLTVFGLLSIASLRCAVSPDVYLICSANTVTFPFTGDCPLTVRTPPFCSGGNMLDGNLPSAPILGILLGSFPTSDTLTLLVSVLRLMLLPKATTLPI